MNSIINDGVAQELARKLTYTNVSLSVGDMLYLPAGWFHEVSSSGGRHSAINFWWKPIHWETAKDFELSRQSIVDNMLLRLNDKQ